MGYELRRQPYTQAIRLWNLFSLLLLLFAGVGRTLHRREGSICPVVFEYFRVLKCRPQMDTTMVIQGELLHHNLPLFHRKKLIY